MSTGVADLLVIHVPAGGQVLAASDIHLGGHGSHRPVEDLTAAIERASGPGVLVLAGDVLELVAGDVRDVRTVLEEEGRLTGAVRAFAACEGRRVVYLLGNHDSRLAWDSGAAAAVTEAFCCELALALELKIDTGQGVRRVQVEHGHRLDSANSYIDPRDPLDVPLGTRVVQQLTPAIHKYAYFNDADSLPDPLSFPRFIASRLAYRRFARHLKWLVLPFLLALLLKLPLTLSLFSRTAIGARIAHWPGRFLFLGGLVVADLVLVVAALALAAYAVWEAVANAALDPRRGRNDSVRVDALARIRDGYAGMITGHSHLAELTPLGDGFYANTGCCAEVLEECRARIGPLPIFRPVRQASWIELEAGSDLHVRLVRGRQPMPAGSTLERLNVRRQPSDARPGVVASLPGGAVWPPPADKAGHQRRVRARAATAIAVVGLLNLVSAVMPPVFQRIEWLRSVVPLAIPEFAGALVAVAGMGLLFLAAGVRRGGRRAWATALGLLVGSALFHLAKGVEVGAAVIALGVAGYLSAQRSAFRGGAARGGVRHALITAAAGTAAAILAGTAVVHIWVRHPHLPLGQALAAVTMRLVGITSIALPDHVNDFMTSAMVGVGLGLVALAAWTFFRPAYGTRRALGSGIGRAREIVAVHAGDSLSSFALRQDKELFFHGDTVVPHSVTGRVCLVSPDPVGPTWERDAAWDAFHRYADGRGWPVAVLGASDDWLPVYRRSGMRELYVGDEAIVDCRRFVEPARADNLRAAVRQVREAGYRVEFLDPARLDAYLESALRGLATEVRRPECEQRLAMTLGRLFDAEDRNLLLAVAMGPDNHPAAFCQFVPAPAIGGYTLDQVRRTTRDIPPRLVEAILVETILHLGTGGTHYLGLNFSVMSRKLARSDADGLGGRAQRWLLDHLSRPEQAGRPWRVDEMFEPEWRPRYFVYDGRGHFPSAAMAMGRAESQRPFPSVGQSATPSGTGAGTGTRGGANGHGRGNGSHGSNGHKRARRNARDAAMDQDAATDGERRAGWKAPSSG
ncbi:MAG: hypothetical protein JWL57_3557 [Actinobacteria bacterium]|nr:hypothetical protein [Actinomycetota bacterium]